MRIETAAQAVQWGMAHNAIIKFEGGKLQVYLGETQVGEGETLIEAIDDAELFLYHAESLGAQALEDKPEAIQHEPHPYCCQFHYPLSLRKYNGESKL